MNKKEIKQLGEFEITSGNIMITDPCYNLDTWCQGKLNGVKTGKWFGIVEYSDEGNWGRRCSQLFAIHESELNNSLEVMRWIPLLFDIGVDSGQAGIFDLDVYRNNEGVTLPQDTPANWETDIWYLSCCDKTLRTENAGIISGGVVSSSGYGDGSYTAYEHKNSNGEITGVKIIFLEEDEEEICINCGEEMSNCYCDNEEGFEDE